ALRRRQRRHARVLRLLGSLALLAAAGLVLRQTVFRGGQPEPPAVEPVVHTAPQTPASAHVAVDVRPATADVLAETQQADAEARSTPAPQASATPETARSILPQYQALYEQNPDMVGWLRVEGTDIDYPVMQTPGDNEY